MLACTSHHIFTYTTMHTHTHTACALAHTSQMPACELAPTHTRIIMQRVCTHDARTQARRTHSARTTHARMHKLHNWHVTSTNQSAQTRQILWKMLKPLLSQKTQDKFASVLAADVVFSLYIFHSIFLFYYRSFYMRDGSEPIWRSNSPDAVCRLLMFASRAVGASRSALTFPRLVATPNIYIYIYIYTYIHIYIYINICIDRERERERERDTYIDIDMTAFPVISDCAPKARTRLKRWWGSNVCCILASVLRVPNSGRFVIIEVVAGSRDVARILSFVNDELD